MVDTEIHELIAAEVARQSRGLEMIPSENHTSAAVLKALGSRLTDKYSEGYPGKRYYGGCEVVDQVENLARDRAKKLFGVSHANVQPYSGSPANMAVYFALADPGDTVMGMALYFGGHMTHGLKVNFSGKWFSSVQYNTGKDGRLDYEAMADLVREHKPKLIFVGATAYPRIFDWAKLRQIADLCDAYLAADISHIAGLVVAGVHPSPVGFADVITTTTHKTLRGPRAGLVLCKEKYAKDLDRSLFPGIQGGPLVHIIAAKAVAFREALSPEFKEYQGQIVRNAKALAAAVADTGFRIVSGGTDNHVFMTDVFSKGITGKDGQNMLEAANITVNKNTIPFDTQKPMVASGVRIGTPAVTTRGLREGDMKTIAQLIARVLDARGDEGVTAEVRKGVKELCDKYPIY